MFLPTTKKEFSADSNELDIILVSGDSYIDSPYIGVAVIGKVLEDRGYRVGIIGQPDIDSEIDILRLGVPRLFWGVTGGCIDSMVANRTATGRKRKSDDYTPGGVNNRRPDRAIIAYTNLIKKHTKNTPRPIVLGGIEASLRRISHFDAWSNKIRRSLLFDAKADYLLYGMAERSVVELADCLRDGPKDGSATRHVRGLCYIAKEVPDESENVPSIEIPSFEQTSGQSNDNKDAFARAFKTFYDNNDPAYAKRLIQKHGDRYLVQNPPAKYLTQKELDHVYGLDYARELHPYHQKEGKVKALETIRFAITTHRGCFAECNFCAIAVHEGRRVRSRSRKSIVEEAKKMTRHPLFKGRVHDVGGPTANMYGAGCDRMETKGCCRNKSCLSPKACVLLEHGHAKQISLLKELRSIEGIKKIAVASGVRYDMVLDDKKYGNSYLKELVTHHVSGQMKIAPEHTEPPVLEAMNKQACGKKALVKFKELFYRYNKEAGLKQFLTYYLMAAHPGCTEVHMRNLKIFVLKELGTVPEQAQVFTPSPSTYSTLMYVTEKDPFTNKPCFVEKTEKGRQAQKDVILDARAGGAGAVGRRGKRGSQEYKKKKSRKTGNNA